MNTNITERKINIEKYYHYMHNNKYVFYGHRHKSMEINVLLKGEMEITCNENVYKLEKGDFILIPSYCFHQNRVLGKERAEMIVIHFFEESLTAEEITPGIYHLTDKIKTILLFFCEDMEVSSDVKYGNCINVSKSAEKLLDIFLDYMSKLEEKNSDSSDEKTQIYNRAVKYMNEHISEKLKISDIAGECHVCNTTIKKIFSHYTGLGCIELFNGLKLEKAKKLLNMGKKCSEVSEALGFSSQAYFSKRYKLMYGFPPSKQM